MTKSQTHFQAFGYELNAIKPVHLANGFFLALTGKHYRLEWLNKLSVVSHKKGLTGDYETERLHEILSQERAIVSKDIQKVDLGLLRTQVNAIAANDDAVYAAFDDYSAFGNDYTASCPALLCDINRKDGYAGYFLFRIFQQTQDGTQILDLAKCLFESKEDSIANLLKPVLDPEIESADWNNRYLDKLGFLTDERLLEVASVMTDATRAVLRNLEHTFRSESRYTSLRHFVMSLGIWLSLYLIRESTNAAELPECLPLYCDFTGNRSRKSRSRSSTCFSRHRELVYRAFEFWGDSGRIEDLSAFKKKNGEEFEYKDLERHFADLTVRVGLAQPRAAQVRAKHYELQPDTIRMLVGSVLGSAEVLTLPDLARRLRETWLISFGGCDDDGDYLANHSIVGLDEDDDLRLNRGCFIQQLKALGLAFEPSDGLVLCGLNQKGDL